LDILLNCPKNTQDSLKSDKNNRYVTWRPIYIFDQISPISW